MSTNNTKGPTKAELQAQVDSLTKQLEEALAVIKNTVNTVATAPTVPTTDIEFVYMSNSLGVVETRSVSFNFSKYGDTVSVSRQQFDEVVGKYRDWFDRGILAVDPKYKSIALAKGLRTSDELGLDVYTLYRIGDMPVSELEELWNKAALPSQRASIVSYFKDKIVKRDTKYFVSEKIDLLNRLTHGAFNSEADEVHGRDMKAPVRDLMKAKF